jgi:DNA processing protein
VLSPADLLAGIRSGTIPAEVTGVPGNLPAAQVALRRYRDQLHRVPAGAGLVSFAGQGIRLICPGDRDWPPQLDDLGAARPYALWVDGTAGLRSCSPGSVSIMGSRAATAYGAHVATEIATSLVPGLDDRVRRGLRSTPPRTPAPWRRAG